MSLDIKSYTDRLVQSYSEQRRAEAHSRLVAALRTIPPDMRESEAKAAIKRLARQELVEIKIKNLSEDELDRLSKRSLAEATEHRLPCVMLGRRRFGRTARTPIGASGTAGFSCRPARGDEIALVGVSA
jgi:hypothetical protein